MKKRYPNSSIFFFHGDIGEKRCWTNYTTSITYESPPEPADMTQHPAGRIGFPEDISNMVLFLCSDNAGFITGENIIIDGGMSHQMIYHNDCGWMLNH